VLGYPLSLNEIIPLDATETQAAAAAAITAAGLATAAALATPAATIAKIETMIEQVA